MSNQENKVAMTTQDEQPSYIYQAFNLTKEESRKVIDKCVPFMDVYGEGLVVSCTVAKQCMDAVDSTDEKLYAMHLFGIYYGICEYTDVSATEYYSEM